MRCKCGKPAIRNCKRCMDDYGNADTCMIQHCHKEIERPTSASLCLHHLNKWREDNSLTKHNFKTWFEQAR